MSNPFSDAWNFLIGNTDDYNVLGNWKYLLVALFWALIAGCTVIAIRNWSEDPQQRSGRNIGILIVRVLTGAMWFQGMIWKLPLPVSDGFKYWTEQIGTGAAFEFHRAFATNFLVPNLYWLATLVFLAELFFAVSLILGIVVRLAGFLGILYVLHLWLGLYNHQGEWPWTYVFLVFVMFLLMLDSAGRSLGVDAMLHRAARPPQDGRGAGHKLLNLVS